jgi:phage replication-related protein YjqB (UPF0714/DUF867 family)
MGESQVADKYSSFPEMLKHATENVDFRIRHEVRNSAAAIVAPHAGGIEPGTSELAEAIAGKDHSFYLFEGIRSSDNGDLHITSTRFREARCDNVTGSCSVVVTLHGKDDDSDVVFLGGKDDPAAVEANRLRKAITDELVKNSFAVSPSPAGIEGRESDNVCNRGSSGAGIQLELSLGLRASMFQNVDRRAGRRIRTQRFHDFVAAIRSAV